LDFLFFLFSGGGSLTGKEFYFILFFYFFILLVLEVFSGNGWGLGFHEQPAHLREGGELS
jgi:hypothetical protein